MSTIEAAIAHKLKHGPQWVRSFSNAPAALAEMRRRGFVQFVSPPGGAGTNMVKLTDEGRVHYLRDNYALTRLRKSAETVRLIEEFAELIANGWSATAAARKLGRTQQTGSAWFRQIRRGLGAQADPKTVGPDLTTPEMVAFLGELRARRAAQ